ncbi:MAG: hypothetical protein WDN47_01505 [Candidatus Doudnabacteria bacterium]
MTPLLSQIPDGQIFVLLEPAGNVRAHIAIIRKDKSFFLLKHDNSPYGEPLKIPGDPISVPVNYITDWKA